MINRSRWIRKLCNFKLVALAVFVTFSVADLARADAVRVMNPYAEVDWRNFEQYKANLHTHTTRSDGQMEPAAKIDAYHELGYSILAITDHDTHRTEATTWPWTDFDRDPEELGMLAVHGNEISRAHHIGSFFNDYGDREQTCENTSLEEIAARNGLAIMYHPGRYDRPVDWYADLYETHDHLIGLEVYNQGDRYPGDRATWDRILSETMPERPVWGYACDDAHSLAHVGRNWQMFIMPELTEDALRNAMTKGHSYFAYTPQRGDPAPLISDIIVDEAEKTIMIAADGYERVIWISNGEEIATGATISIADMNGYLRAVLISETGRTYTQPFYVEQTASN